MSPLIDWQPMESIPRDGRWVQILGEDGAYKNARWLDGEWVWRGFAGDAHPQPLKEHRAWRESPLQKWLEYQ